MQLKTRMLKVFSGNKKKKKIKRQEQCQSLEKKLKLKLNVKHSELKYSNM